MTIDSRKKIGPRPEGYLSAQSTCPACHRSFEAGDYTTLIALGPGDDLEEQDKAAAGVGYIAVGVEVHWACATGDRT